MPNKAGPLASFVVKRAPLSCNAKNPKHYISHLECEFRRHQFPGIPFPGHLYVRVYYFHFIPDKRDADNFSKRVVDALKGAAYVDDSFVILRTAANIHLPAHSGINLTHMEEPALSVFIDAQSKQEPTLYIEIGTFEGSLILIGGA